MRIWAVLLLTVPAFGQFHDNTEKNLKCEEQGRRDWGASFCEVREQTVAAAGRLAADAGNNGGITIRGWSRKDVLIRTRVQAHAESDAEARSLASRVAVIASGGSLRADGPSPGTSRANWSTSYEIFVPWQTDLDLKANNGGLSVSDVTGHLEAHTQNGGLHIARVGGDVHGATVNGGVHLELSGPRFDGQGMDLESVNGGVHVAMPAGYAARVEAATVNGGVHNEFAPVAERSEHNTAVTLGSGGPLIRLHTSNGGVHIARQGT